MKKVGRVLNTILDLKKEDKPINLATIEKRSKIHISTVYGCLKDLTLTGFIMEDPTTPGTYILNGNPAQMETGFSRLFPELTEVETLRTKLKSIYTKRTVGRPKKNIFGF